MKTKKILLFVIILNLIVLNSVSYGFSSLYSFKDDFKPSVTSESKSYYTYVEYPSSSVKLYLPPGTTDYSLLYYSSNDSLCSVHASLKSEPNTDNTEYTYSRIFLNNYLNNPGKTYSMYLTDSGSAYLASASGYTPLSAEKSGWLYIKSICEKGSIKAIKTSFTVNSNTYAQWYNNTTDNTNSSSNPECVDSNKATSLSGFCWDTSGNPWVSGVATAAPSCSPDNLSLCETKSECDKLANTYWYDNDNDSIKTCNTEPPCTSDNLSECNTETKCESITSFDTYWYDNNSNGTDTCNEVSPCTQDNETWDPVTNTCTTEPVSSCVPYGDVSGCSTERECELAGGYWDSANNSCVTSSSSGSTGGSSDGSGSTTTTCNPLYEALGMCTDSGNTNTDTNTDSTCNPLLEFANACPDNTVSCSEDLSSCQDVASCESSGGFWSPNNECVGYKSLSGDVKYLNENGSTKPLDLGSDLEDFSMDDGDEFRWNISYGPFNQNVNFYLAFQLTGIPELFVVNNNGEASTAVSTYKSNDNYLDATVYQSFEICPVIGDNSLVLYYGAVPSGKQLSNASSQELDIGYVYLENNCSPRECTNETPMYCSTESECEQNGGYWDASSSSCIVSKNINKGQVSSIRENYSESFLNLNSSARDWALNKDDSIEITFDDLGPYSEPVDLYLAYAYGNTIKFLAKDETESDIAIPYVSNITGIQSISDSITLSGLCDAVQNNDVTFGYILTSSGSTFDWSGEIGYFTLANKCDESYNTVDLSERDCLLKYYEWDSANNVCIKK